MYINVKLLNGFYETLTYKVPATWDLVSLPGSLVEVPLRNRKEKALVVDIFDTLPAHVTYTIKEALSQEQIPYDASYAPWIDQLSAYYAIEPQVLYKRLRAFLQAKPETEVVPSQESTQNKTPHVNLTPEQQEVVDTLCAQLDKNTYSPSLIHGVTGSGKTEIYKQVIATAYAQKKTCVFLVPEVSLALQFTQVFKNYFGEAAPIFGFHSAITPKQKKELWELLLTKKPAIIIGVHLPLLLPLHNVGVIIIDEEHDSGFQEKRHPRINVKEAALLRARLAKIPIILGSATPSIATLAHKFPVFKLHKRFSGAFPAVQVVTLNKDKRKSFWISKELEKAITTTLEKKEQIIIFINRRGYSFFVQCGDCNFVFACPTCSVSLTLHNNNQIVCHYCGHTQQVPPACPNCKAPEKNFIKKGIGTQQVVTLLEKLFPHARIGRADLDVSSNKKKWQETMQQFYNHELDILVGTQTITKGYHFPKVTCVGILWADINLNFPFYTASETTLQQLIQVAGRAGRQTESSTVIIQTMINHPLYNFINEQKYLDFYAYETENRKITNYPPFTRFAEIELRSTSESQVQQDADDCADFLHAVVQQHNLPITILGPAQPPVHKIKNISSYKIYLKGPQYAQLAALYLALKKRGHKSALFYTPNPLS